MSVFDQNTQEPKIETSPVNTGLFEDKLKTIVNEQGQPKYKDVDTALEALKVSQDHIKRLEAEAREREARERTLAEQATKAAALEEVLERLTKTNSQANTKEVTPPNSVTDEEAITKILKKVLTQDKEVSRIEANRNQVQNALVAKFGDEVKTKEAVALKAKELNTTPEQLGDLARTNPQVVLTLFGVTASSSTAQPTIASITPPFKQNDQTQLKRPEKSLLSGVGATDKNRRELMRQIKEEVYKKNGIDL